MPRLLAAFALLLTVLPALASEAVTVDVQLKGQLAKSGELTGRVTLRLAGGEEAAWRARIGTAERARREALLTRAFAEAGVAGIERFEEPVGLADTSEPLELVGALRPLGLVPAHTEPTTWQVPAALFELLTWHDGLPAGTWRFGAEIECVPGYAVGTPEPVELAAADARLTARSELDGATLRIERSLHLTRPTGASALTVLRDEVREALGRVLVIKRVRSFDALRELESLSAPAATRFGAEALNAEPPDAERARRLAEHAIARDAEHANAWLVLARAERQLARREEAIVALRALLDLQPDHEPARLELAELLAELGRTDEALAAFDEVLRLAPGSPEARLRYARALVALGQEERAHVLLEELPAALVDGASGHLRWAVLLEEAGFHEPARRAALSAYQATAGPHYRARVRKRLARLGVSVDAIVERAALLARAQCKRLEIVGMNDEAHAALGIVLDAARAIDAHAIALDDAGRPEAALDVLRHALRLDPDDERRVGMEADLAARLDASESWEPDTNALTLATVLPPGETRVYTARVRFDELGRVSALRVVGTLPPGLEEALWSLSVPALECGGERFSVTRYVHVRRQENGRPRVDYTPLPGAPE